MIRANEPAMSIFIPGGYSSNGAWAPKTYMGLTIREHFALEAMCASLSGTPGHHLSPPNLYREAIAHADALIAELAKEKQT